MSEYDDHYARWSYEQLLLKQPHIEFHGLWRVGSMHYIVCPHVGSAQTIDGENLRAWFDSKCRVVTAPVQIVVSCPTDAEPVPERTPLQRALLAGAPRTRRHALVDLSLALPPEFPPFTLDTPGGDVVMVSTRDLTAEEQASANETYRNLGHFAPLKFAVDATRQPEQEEFRFTVGQLRQGDIELIPSRRLGGRASRDLRFLVEEDEQTWVDKRELIFTSIGSGPGSVLPEGWATGDRLSCLVDATVSAPENIRAYLSLYEIVHLALPLESVFEKNCAALGVSPEELAKLVQTGRVRLLLPQAVDRYPADWLGGIAESAPKNLLFSRRLAAATIIDARQRVPLLFPPLGPAERYALLHAIAAYATELVGVAQSGKLVRFVGGLGETWSNAEWSVQTRGAMGTSHSGIGGVAAAVYEQITGRDLRLELWSAAQKVEWAAALGAHAFPGGTDSYDEANACDLVAGVYGPQIGHRSIVVPKTALSAITELLAIDNRVSVVDFAKEFSSADVSRLREIVLRLARENVDQDYLADAIAKFNAEVRHYERRPDLLKTLNVVGCFSAGAVAAGAVDPSIQRVVPLAGILLGFVINRVIDELPRYSGAAGSVIDFLNSVLTGRANPDAVLVARARKEVTRFRT